MVSPRGTLRGCFLIGLDEPAAGHVRIIASEPELRPLDGGQIVVTGAMDAVLDADGVWSASVIATDTCREPFTYTVLPMLKDGRPRIIRGVTVRPGETVDVSQFYTFA